MRKRDPRGQMADKPMLVTGGHRQRDSSGTRVLSVRFGGLAFRIVVLVNNVGGYWHMRHANVLCELSRRLRGTSVTANALHPGAVSTAFRAEDPAIIQ